MKLLSAVSHDDHTSMTGCRNISSPPKRKIVAERLCRMGNAPEHRRDDSRRHHHLCRHVLLRGCRRARNQRSRDARHLWQETIVDFLRRCLIRRQQRGCGSSNTLKDSSINGVTIRRSPSRSAPLDPSTLSEANLQAACALARRNGVPILIHIAEAPFETAHSRSRHGLSPVAYLQRIGLLGPDVVGAHCVWVDSADIAALGHFDVGSVHNPSSNMKLAAGVMPVVDMLAAGNRLRLASNRRRRQQQQPGSLRRDGSRRQTPESWREWIRALFQRSKPSKWPRFAARTLCIWRRRSAPSRTAKEPT